MGKQKQPTSIRLQRQHIDCTGNGGVNNAKGNVSVNNQDPNAIDRWQNLQNKRKPCWTR
jgi:hypothetical protein